MRGRSEGRLQGSANQIRTRSPRIGAGKEKIGDEVVGSSGEGGFEEIGMECCQG